MKLLIVSDTHGYLDNLRTVRDTLGYKPDYVFHLGDFEGQAEEIRYMFSCPAAIVAGNNDFFTDLPKELDFTYMGVRFMLTHGHRYNVSLGIEHLKLAAMYKEAKVVCFGHTHEPLIAEEKGILFMNPGSLTYPRQCGRMPSYITADLEQGIVSNPKIHYLDRG